MNPSMAKPTVDSFVDGATIGAIYGRCILTALIIMAVVYALHEAWHMVQAFRLLDQATKIQRAKDSIAPSDTGRGPKHESGIWR